MYQQIIKIKPLSVNRAWQGRRFRSNDYKAFQQEIALLIKHKGTIMGDVEVVLEFYLKNDKMSDIDNPIKPLLDCLVKNGVLEDDRKIRHLDVYKYHSKNERVNVVINSLAN